jgi:hypothetical protein
VFFLWQQEVWWWGETHHHTKKILNVAGKVAQGAKAERSVATNAASGIKCRLQKIFFIVYALATIATIKKGRQMAAFF